MSGLEDLEDFKMKTQIEMIKGYYAIFFLVKYFFCSQVNSAA